MQVCGDANEANPKQKSELIVKATNTTVDIESPDTETHIGADKDFDSKVKIGDELKPSPCLKDEKPKEIYTQRKEVLEKTGKHDEPEINKPSEDQDDIVEKDKDKIDKREADRLLNKAECNVEMGNLRTANLLLIASYNMHTNQRSIFIYEKLLDKRLALNSNRRDEISKNIFESDKLAISALNKYRNYQFYEAKELLIEANKLCSSELILLIINKIIDEKIN